MKELSQEKLEEHIKKLTHFYGGDYNLFVEESLQNILNSIVFTIKQNNINPFRSSRYKVEIHHEDLKKFVETFLIDFDLKDDKYIFKYTNKILIKIVELVTNCEDGLSTLSFLKVNDEESLDEKVLRMVLEHAHNTNDITLHAELLNNHSNLISKFSLYSKTKNNILKNSQKINDFTMFNNLLHSCNPYHYELDKIAEAMIAGVKINNDYSFLIDFVCTNHYTPSKSSSIIDKIKAFKYLVSIGKLEDVDCIIKDLATNSYGDGQEEMISLYCEKCMTQNKVEEIIKIWKLYFSNCEVRSSAIQSFSELFKEKIFEVLKKSNKNEKDITNFLIILWYEAKTILQDYSHIDFSQYPETAQSLMSLDTKDGIQKFHKYILKVLKSGKPILALYILNNQGYYSNKSDAKLWIDSYIEAFVLLNKVDILAKHYDAFGASINSIELLQRIAEYYIREKDSQMALKIVDNISLLEPTYPFIESSKQEISRLSMVSQLLCTNIDVDNMNSLSGQEFEQLLINKFIDLGYKIIETPHTRDFGADIIVDTESDTRFVIQCKRFKSKVNLKAVQEVVGALPHYNGDIGIVITNSGFLSSAIKLAESNEIELWDNLKLMKFLTGDISFSQMKDF